MSSNDQVNLALGLFVALGGGYYAIKKIINRQRIYQNQTLYHQAFKCNLNQISIKKEKDIFKDGQKHFHNRLISIENVMAHFPQNTFPVVKFKGRKYDDYARIATESFFVVQKKYNKDQFSLYKINVRDTLASQTVLIPEVTLRNPNKSSQQSHSSPNYSRILTSASSLGIIGTLSLASDNADYTIDAKIIGCSLQDIGKYIDQQKFYNNFGIFLGSVFVVLGVGWMIKTYRDMSRNRVPLEFSLLNTSKK